MYDETLTPTKLALIHTGIKSYLSFIDVCSTTCTQSQKARLLQQETRNKTIECYTKHACLICFLQYILNVVPTCI